MRLLFAGKFINRSSVFMVLLVVLSMTPITVEAETVTKWEYSALSGKEPSEIADLGFSASSTGTADIADGVLRTSDADATADGRYYTLPVGLLQIDNETDVTLTFDISVKRSVGNRTATAVELPLRSDVFTLGPLRIGAHGEGYQDVRVEGRKLSVGFVSDGANHDLDQILLIDSTCPGDKGILARALVRLDQPCQFEFSISRQDPGLDDDLVSLSMKSSKKSKTSKKLISVPLSRFQSSPQAVSHSLIFGHPASSGLADAEWRELTLRLEHSSVKPPQGQRLKSAVDIGTQRQLFVDDFIIQNREHLKREQGQMVKSADNPVLKREMPWEASRCELYGSSIWNPEQQRIELFYSASKVPYDAKLALAYSTNKGKTWNRPKWDVFPWEGKSSNIVWPGRYWTHGPCVMYDAHDTDPSRRYKLFVTAAPLDPAKENDRTGPKGIDAAFSPDGIHWTAAPQNPVIRGFNSDTGNSVIWDEERKLYRAYIRIRCNVGRSVGITESPDFIRWTEPRTIYIPTGFDSAKKREYYGLSVTKIDGLYLGLVWIFPNTPESSNMQSHAAVTWPELVVSRDGEHWQRPFPGEPFLPLGGEGEFDHRQIRPASSFTVLDDRVLLLYSGSPHAHVSLHKWDIGMATLRTDGFAALRALAQPGKLLTRPLKFKGRALHVNADVDQNGYIKAELIDSHGNVLNGYELSECQPVVGDQTKARVRWNSKSTLPDSREIPVRLRLELKNARMYSFHVK